VEAKQALQAQQQRARQQQALHHFALFAWRQPMDQAQGQMRQAAALQPVEQGAAWALAQRVRADLMLLQN
jgi:hypothetical protein